MALSPNKRRFFALGLGFACLAVQIGTLAILLAIHKAGGSPGNAMGSIVLVVLAGVIPVGFSFLSAVWAKNFDRAALITALVPAAAAFIASYAGSVHEFGYREPHTMYHTIGGPAHPLDPIGQGLVILLSGTWALGVAFAAKALKRGFFAMRGLGDTELETSESDRPFAFHLTLIAIFAACVVGMVAYAGYVAFQNLPEQRVAKSARILDSPASTAGKRQWAWRQLWRIQSPASNAVLAKAADGQPPPSNVLAACLLASHNEISHLALAEATLMQPVLPAKWEFFPNPGALLGHIEDSRAAPVLARLMKAPDPRVRQGAARALRHMKTGDSLEALAGGLNDPDWEVRWLSVMGLAEIVGPKDGKSWYPDSDKFKAEEKKYLDHWNAWAASRSRSVDGK